VSLLAAQHPWFPDTERTAAVLVGVRVSEGLQGGAAGHPLWRTFFTTQTLGSPVNCPRTTRYLVLAAVLSFSGCSDRVSVADPLNSMKISEEPRAQPEIGSLEHLAIALARAMATDSVRHDILFALQSSPHRGHPVHWQSFLESEDGRRTLEHVASQMGLSPGSLLALALRGESLELAITSPLHRIAWAGSDDILVMGLEEGYRSRLTSFAQIAYDIRGGEVPVDVRYVSRAPILSLAPWPSEVWFSVRWSSRRAKWVEDRVLGL